MWVILDSSPANPADWERCVRSHPHLTLGGVVSNDSTTWSDAHALPDPDFVVTSKRLTPSQINVVCQRSPSAVISTRGFRHNPAGWNHHQVTLSHQDLGGVTGCSVNVHYLTSHSTMAPLVPQTGRDCRTVLEFSRCFDHYIPAPSQEVVPLRSLEVSPGVYHSRGLLPHPLPTPCHIAVP